MVATGNKAKRLLSVNHTAETFIIFIIAIEGICSANLTAEKIKLRLNAFLRSTIPQKQFIIFIIIMENLSLETQLMSAKSPLRKWDIYKIFKIIQNCLIDEAKSINVQYRIFKEQI